MKLSVLILILPIVPFILAVFKQRPHSSFFKKWFSELCIYLMYLIRGSALAYVAILMVLITACSIIKTIEFNLLAFLEVQAKIFIVAWTLSFIATGFRKPILVENNF